MNDALLERQLRKIPGVLAVSTSVEAVTVLVHPEVHALVIEAQASAAALRLGDPRPVTVIGGNRPTAVGGSRNQFDVIPKLRTVAPAAALVGVAALVVGLAGSPIAWFHGLNPANSHRQEGAARLAPNGVGSPGSPGGRPSVGSPLSGLVVGTSGVTALPASAQASAAAPARTSTGPTVSLVSGGPTSRMPAARLSAPSHHVQLSKAPHLPSSSPVTLLASAGLPSSPSVLVSGPDLGGGVVGGVSSASRPLAMAPPSKVTKPEPPLVEPVVEQPTLPPSDRDDGESEHSGEPGHGRDGDDDLQGDDALGEAIRRAVRRSVGDLAHQPRALPAAAHSHATAEKSRGRGRLMARLRSTPRRLNRH
jgi:hypothetical protein